MESTRALAGTRARKTTLVITNHAEYTRFQSVQTSPDTPLNTSLAFLCMLPLADAAYLASIVIGLHTPSCQRGRNSSYSWHELSAMADVSWGKVVCSLTEWRNTPGRPGCLSDVSWGKVCSWTEWCNTPGRPGCLSDVSWGNICSLTEWHNTPGRPGCLSDVPGVKSVVGRSDAIPQVGLDVTNVLKSRVDIINRFIFFQSYDTSKSITDQMF
jgi:hypothetical protein